MSSEVTTNEEIFEESLAMKHPLEHAWNFWLFSNEHRSWEKNLISLSTFNTVEDYWCLYHHMKFPSQLTPGQDYYIFKENIQPMWEDKANVEGGRWLISLEKKRDLDQYWLDVVLLMIGETFENNDDVCGAVVNVRPAARSKLCIWMSDSSRKEANIEVAAKIKEQLRVSSKLIFRAHNKTVNLYTV